MAPILSAPGDERTCARGCPACGGVDAGNMGGPLVIAAGRYVAIARPHPGSGVDQFADDVGVPGMARRASSSSASMVASVCAAHAWWRSMTSAVTVDAAVILGGASGGAAGRR
ncbi:hypothetical protein [Homoserinimonas hongtaonis]|uniref:hypothetical protein n=1 Tax=Homoserinimonas hongtaonis TaxID=2079791 RepID=UPI001304D415